MIIKTYQEIRVGDEASFYRKITKKDMDMFAKITYDLNPLHNDAEYVSQTIFKRPIVYGLLINSFLSSLAGMHLPGKYSLTLSMKSDFKKPCFIGDTLTIRGKVIKKIEFGKIILLKTEIANQKSEIILDGTMHIKVLK